MFTGIVLEKSQVLAFDPIASGGMKLVVNSQLPEAASWPLGASVSINGVCLTIVSTHKESNSVELCFEVSHETLSRSNLGELSVGSLVHVESALNFGASLGGHLVSGHVDGVGSVEDISPNGEFWSFEISVEGAARSAIAPFLVEKGSIAVDGVSLTVNQVRDDESKTYFSMVLIPHTMTITRFKQLNVGDRVNLEADILAKYANRYAQFKDGFKVGLREGLREKLDVQLS